MGGKETKVTTMILKVGHLGCPKCHKKIKKILCRFPEIQDQVFDEKDNKVTITVICSDPEKLRDKLCCKGCGLIQSIEIVKPKCPTPDPPRECRCHHKCSVEIIQCGCYWGGPACYCWGCRVVISHECYVRCDCISRQNPSACTGCDC